MSIVTSQIISFKKKRNSYENNLTEHLTTQEKKSESIERKIMERACSLYLKNSKKRFFMGIIDGIESFGIFIKAIDLPFSCLARVRNQIVNKINYELGQKVSFRIRRNDIFSGKILADNVKIIN